MHRVRRVEVLVLPKKGHWALNLRTLESLSIWEKGNGDDGKNKGVGFYIFQFPDWSAIRVPAFARRFPSRSI